MFGNRAYFIYDKLPGQLAIQHVHDDDTGIYRCRVDFEVAQTRNSIVNLTVIGKWDNTLFLFLSRGWMEGVP